MVGYEALTSDKKSILLDIGAAYTRAGFTSEYVPRVTIRSRLKSQNEEIALESITDPGELKCALKQFLQFVFFRHLGTNTTDKSVVLLESVFWTDTFRKTIVDVLFESFRSPSVLIVPQHVMALCPLGLRVGLVLDVGYRETVAIPVYENVTILNCAQFAPYGGRLLHRRIMDELVQRGARVTVGYGHEDMPVGELDEDVLEDIKVKCCFIAPYERGVHLVAAKVDPKIEVPIPCDIVEPPCDQVYPLTDTQMLRIPGGLRESVGEIMFEMFGEEATIATLIIETILQCPIDLRVPLASNIVVIGGGSMLPGFLDRLIDEVRTMASGCVKYDPLPYADKFAFHELPCPANYASWLGASLFATTDRITLSATSRSQWQKGETIPDWSEGWIPV